MEVDLSLDPAWALRVGIYQYECEIAIFHEGRSATWSGTCSARVGIYQYESQIAIIQWGIDLPLDLPEVSEKESQITFFQVVYLSLDPAWALRVGIYQYESKIVIFQGGW